ncbi:hypothetical protein FJV41_48445 [Myxococcus llanfairpwllgwyngyllgogerychwyrndrobwllllantysiliogogogochensis]|uniref:Uncharacterized protein n=2 Tax=Myxococcus llanfairpwllgwyngyllgogerychwyrndrobwllllantysiliogogogochensis TaxID=2590453 RepID=A0A540WI96_9BACT|nr:hypothetical protein FJV41_48445 [Myxococcus llanfairpwllgwyngyllgogerychwyrndrobwllllantysiliogogogochensis]
MAEEIPAIVTKRAVSANRNEVSCTVHAIKGIFLCYDDAFRGKVLPHSLYMDHKGRLLRTTTVRSTRAESEVETTTLDYVSDDAMNGADRDMVMHRCLSAGELAQTQIGQPKVKPVAVAAA